MIVKEGMVGGQVGFCSIYSRLLVWAKKRFDVAEAQWALIIETAFE